MNVSALPKTWFLDLDGTLVVHNGHLTPEGDTLLPGVVEFCKQIPPSDFVVITTSRPDSYSSSLEAFLLRNGIRFNAILYNLPVGERILVNDRKPSGLQMAYAINKDRNAPFFIDYKVDINL